MLRRLLDERILLLDGAIGTLIQPPGQGSASLDLPDCAVLETPEAVSRAHEEYFKAGADIITTNTFNSNAVSLSEFGISEKAYLLSRDAAILARKAADIFTSHSPSKPRFVAGSVGPTKHVLSNPERCADIKFDTLFDAYLDQMRGLVDGGADLILIETVFDLKNAEAALQAVGRLETERMVKIPVIVSATFNPHTATILSGESPEEFCDYLKDADLLAVGINCSNGSEGILPLVKRLSASSHIPVAVFPNAGMPDNNGGYHDSPDFFAANLERCMALGLVNIVGGCCGTTPAHIFRLSSLVTKYRPFVPSKI